MKDFPISDTKWLEEYEADKRDIKISDVFWTTSVKLPKKTNFREKIYKTNNQWCVPSCTATGWSNVILSQNAKERDFNVNIEVDNEYIREMMWHENVCQEKWDYLEKFLKTISKIPPKWRINWEPTTFPIVKYAYEKMPNIDNIDEFNQMKIWIYNNWPLYFATRWNRTLWNEMQEWEVKTIVTKDKATGWHALWGIIDYDDEKKEFWVLNTWTPNYKREWKKNDISIFKMSYYYFKKALSAWQLSWRYRIIYDKKDIKPEALYPDFNPNVWTEAYEAVKWAKDNWIITWAPHSDWQKYLEPNNPVTRLQLAIILYRFNNK